MGQVLSVDDGWVVVDVKNKFAVGDRLEIIHPSGNREVTLETLFHVEGQPLEVAPGNGILVKIPLDKALDGALVARLF